MKVNNFKDFINERTNVLDSKIDKRETELLDLINSNHLEFYKLFKKYFPEGHIQPHDYTMLNMIMKKEFGDKYTKWVDRQPKMKVPDTTDYDLDSHNEI
jgi:hypothetical protein